MEPEPRRQRPTPRAVRHAPGVPLAQIAAAAAAPCDDVVDSLIRLPSRGRCAQMAAEAAALWCLAHAAAAELGLAAAPVTSSPTPQKRRLTCRRSPPR